MKISLTILNGIANRKISYLKFLFSTIVSPRSFRIVGYAIIFLILSDCSKPVKKPLKIYVNTDLEGITGVYKFAQSREKDTPLNIQACEYFMEDLAAVVQGLRDAGATEVVVLDGHGSQAVIPHMMHPGASYVTGKPRPGAGNLTGLDETFDAMIMIGFHAMMGTPDGVLNHTQSSRSENRYWYNGVESGELAQNALIAGHFGVPLVMVTGDEATCREAHQFFGEEIVTVATKKGLGREAAELYPFERTRKALYEGAKRAVKAIPKIKPYKIDMPIEARKEYLDLNSDLPEPPVIVKEGIIEDVLKITDF
jgi:D-amino peptidase